MPAATLSALLILAAVLCFAAFWLFWSARDTISLPGALLKTAATGLLAAAALTNPDAGFWPVALGLGLGAVGDFALTRRSDSAFLAGMAAFGAGHLAYATAFILRSRDLVTSFDLATPLTIGHISALAAILALLISTEVWLAPRTGALRWPVRGYVVVIGCMAAASVVLAPTGGQNILRLGAALFMLSDVMLALRLFVVSDPRRQRVLSLSVWPTYWLGQALILFGAVAYWTHPIG